MASHRLQTLCQEVTDDHVCNKPIQIIEEIPLEGHLVLRKFKCGHFDTVSAQEHKEWKQKNILWNKLLPFQQDFINWASAVPKKRIILTDEMGLGKTAQSIFFANEFAEEFTANFTKFLVQIVLPGATFQWQEENDKWARYANPTCIEDFYLTPQIVHSGRQKLNPKALVVILPWTRLGEPAIMKQLAKVGVGGIICDEVHFFKDVRSKRTQNFIELCKLAGPDSPLLMLSGTPVENRIMEINVALHLADPQFFYNWQVLDRFLLHDSMGKPTTLQPWQRQRFMDRVSKYWIGRKKSEVDIPLPLNSKGEKAPEFHYEWINPEDFPANEEFAAIYNKTLDELEAILASPSLTAGSIIGLMQQLRHCVGKMKILSAAVWIDNWMTFNPGEKLAVGIHHTDVRNTLCELLKHRQPLSMSGEDNPEQKDAIEREFRNGKNLLICNILAAGTGRNFQFCKNALILERQWNRSKEDQFAQRFHRICQNPDGTVKTEFSPEDMVNIYIFNAKGTFDEYSHDMVDLKGLIADSVDDSIDDLPDETFILTLARNVVKKRMRFMGL